MHFYKFLAQTTKTVPHIWKSHTRAPTFVLRDCVLFYLLEFCSRRSIDFSLDSSKDGDAFFALPLVDLVVRKIYF